MNLLLIPLYEIFWYGLWWLPFIAIAYSLARYFEWFGVIIAVFLITTMIVFIDVHWIFKDMKEHPESGRDADFVFWFGVLCRIILFNLMLVPASIIGMRHRARKCATHETNAS